MRLRYVLTLAAAFAIASVQAATCAPGTAGTLCLACTLGGQYSPGGNSATTSCLKCDVNHYSSLNLAGNTACSPCPADTDTRGSTGAAVCTACPTGTSNYGTGENCAACPAGSQYSAGTSTGLLGDLLAPLVGSTSLPASCKYCPAGASAASGSNCANCAPGTYAPLVGSASCTPAPAGSFVATAGSTSSTKCPYGTYQTQTGQTACTSCATGSGTTSTGSTASSACVARQNGYILQSGQLVSCPAGTTSDAAGASCIACSGNTIAATAGSTCSACPANTGTTDHISCSSVPAGSYYSNGQISACPAGTTSNSDRTGCSACSGNTVAVLPGSATCTACTGTTVTVDHITCTTVPAGSIYSNGQITQCPAGSTSNTGNTACVTCTGNTVAPLAGSAACTPCTGALVTTDHISCGTIPVGSIFSNGQLSVCPAGSVPNSGSTACVSCTGNTVAALAGTGTCTPCTDSLVTTDHILCQAVPAGSIYSNGQISTCAAGTSNNADNTACVACTGNTVAATAGSICVPCTGTLVTVDHVTCQSVAAGSIYSNGQITPCPAGQTSNLGNTACVACLANTIAATPGSTCTACPGSLVTTDHIQCNAVPAGSIYQNGAITLCKAGTVPNSDSTSCVTCAGNTIAPVAGSSTCASCPIGESTTDNILCQPITAGYIYTNGQLSACPQGTTSDSARTTCVPCTGNTIAAIAGSPTCTSCPTLQATTDHIACLPIPAGSIYSNGQISLCPKGTTSDATGTVCNACSGNTIAPALGSASCTACPAQYVTSDNIACSALPLGYIIQNEVVVACGVGTTSDATQSNCISCSGMTIAPVAGSTCSNCPTGMATSDHITCNDIPVGYIIQLDAVVACNAGFTSDPTHATCNECIGLTIASLPGSSCSQCPANQYTTDHISCQPVERGYRIRNSQLEACPAGTTSTGEGDCTECSGNSIAPTEGSASCEPCPGTQETTDHITCQAVASGRAGARRAFKRSEQFLCPSGKTACYKYMSKKAPGRRFECIDTLSDAIACGGCPQGYEDLRGETTGQDCTQYDDVAEASCVGGRCAYKCPHGWTLSEDKGCVWSKVAAGKRRPRAGRRAVARPAPAARASILAK